MLQKRFLEIFTEDAEKTVLARKRRSDTFWSPMVFRKKK